MMDASDFRSMARNALSGNWLLAGVVGLVASILGGTIGSDDIVDFDVNNEDRININLSNNKIEVDELKELDIWPSIEGVVSAFIIVCIISIIVSIIIGGVIALGNAIFQLKLIDGNRAEFSDLFSQFHRIGDGICMIILMGLYTFLWSLCFIIPGIIKAYSYAMTPYILAENPNIGVNDAIDESCRIMEGNKWRLFCMELSFIGWDILCMLPLYYWFQNFEEWAQSSADIGVLVGSTAILYLLSFVGYFFLRPYKEAAHAAFYRDITKPVMWRAATMDNNEF